MNWALSMLATALSLATLWLYGNGSKRAPILGLAMCMVWLYYNLQYDQLPLLLPTSLNIIIHVRNLLKAHNKQATIEDTNIKVSIATKGGKT